jgi:hypothetical protein
VKNNKNFASPSENDSIIVAELSDVFGTATFRLIVKGYESTLEKEVPFDWLNVDIECTSRNFCWQMKRWEINTLSLWRFINSIKHFHGATENPREIMRDYTGLDQVSIIYKKPHVRLKKWAATSKKRSGHFVKGNFGSQNVSLEFKIDRIQLLKFEKKLVEAITRYPIRSRKFLEMLNGAY